MSFIEGQIKLGRRCRTPGLAWHLTGFRDYYRSSAPGYACFMGAWLPAMPFSRHRRGSARRCSLLRLLPSSARARVFLPFCPLRLLSPAPPMSGFRRCWLCPCATVHLSARCQSASPAACRLFRLPVVWFFRRGFRFLLLGCT